MNFKNFKSLFLAILAIGCLFMIGCKGGPTGPEIPDPPDPPPTQDSLEVLNVIPASGSTLPKGGVITVWVKYSNTNDSVIVDGMLLKSNQQGIGGCNGGRVVGKGTDTFSFTCHVDDGPIKTKYIDVFMQDYASQKIILKNTKEAEFNWQ